MSDWSEDLELAIDAVREAGEAVMGYFRQEPEVRFKQADQPVTAADLAADRVLHERLMGARPGYGWLSEESAASADRLLRSRLWVVDPIDGTNSFVEGRPEFVVSVGLVEAGVPQLGVLLNPATGELFHATRGGGAFRDGEPVRVATPPADGARAVLFASRSELRRGEFEAFAAAWEIRPLGSTAYRMLKVADGTGHAFFSRSRKSEWDVCGAELVVTEAGGRVRQADGAPLRYNQPEPVFRGVVASGGLPAGLPPAARLPGLAGEG